MDQKTVRYIYALVDPVHEVVGYIGITENPEIRLKGHLNSRSTKASRERINWELFNSVTGDKRIWLNYLSFLGIKPEMRILESGTHVTTQTEENWIHLMVEAGQPITNDRLPNVPGLNLKLRSIRCPYKGGYCRGWEHNDG